MLEKIVKQKHLEIEAAKQSLPLADLQKKAALSSPPRSLREAILAEKGPKHRIIAEIKRASPSKGLMRADLDPLEWAVRYQSAGAIALSVVTDEMFFHGSLNHLVQARGKVDLPLLRKDFIVEPYQIWEARYFGADVILLIMRILDDEQYKTLLSLTRDVGMEALVEVHDEKDLDRAMAQGAGLIGINNRDLKTFTVDIAVTQRLMPAVPSDVVVVSASGIQMAQQICTLEAAGVKAFLIGEALVTSSAPEEKLKELVA